MTHRNWSQKYYFKTVNDISIEYKFKCLYEYDNLMYFTFLALTFFLLSQTRISISLRSGRQIRKRNIDFCLWHLVGPTADKLKIKRNKDTTTKLPFRVPFDPWSWRLQNKYNNFAINYKPTPTKCCPVYLNSFIKWSLQGHQLWS